MILSVNDEVLVWTSDGYEGRFLRWEADRWLAFEYRNYRHWFSESQELTGQDIQVLRDAYKIPVQLLPDEKLVMSSPKVLKELSNT